MDGIEKEQCIPAAMGLILTFISRSTCTSQITNKKTKKVIRSIVPKIDKKNMKIIILMV